MRIVSFFLTLPLAAQSIASFPGAEGFGATTPGGRGGRVIAVTTLDDSGAGSFRAALAEPGPRIIVFRTGGVIRLKSPLVIREPYVTIAGQSAPGSGICLRGYGLAIDTHDVIVRFLRSRPGDEERKEVDAISIGGSSRNVILDHVSASWAVDETLSPSGAIADVTVQWSIISESLRKSVHSKGSHGYGSLVRAVGGVSLHHNLWANHDGRNPRLGDNYGKGEPIYDFRNNVIFNYGEHCSGMTDGRIRVNYADNLIRPGPSSSQRPPIHLTDAATADTRFYIAGNIVEGREEWTRDNSTMFERREKDGRPLFSLVDKQFETPPLLRLAPREALGRILAEAGAVLPRRDAVDERIVNQVRSGKGRVIDSQSEVGGWPPYDPGIPPVDTDLDGMPDTWEKTHGLDPRNPADASRQGAGGYSNIEIYLNEIALLKRAGGQAGTRL